LEKALLWMPWLLRYACKEDALKFLKPLEERRRAETLILSWIKRLREEEDSEEWGTVILRFPLIFFSLFSKKTFFTFIKRTSLSGPREGDLYKVP
jgi:hypothetical protein